MTIWYCKTFNQLSCTQLYNILKIRQDVFILEQQCFYTDLDDIDQHCLHLFASVTDTQNEDKDGDNSEVVSEDIVAYLRIIPAKLQYPQASFGRVLTTAKVRGTGIGKVLISKAIDEIRLSSPQQEIKISAQLYLQEFYQGFGFSAISNVYDEDGIDHIDMLLK